MTSYDAFISYSHALDKPIAAALQAVIQTLGKPWWKRRMARIFRDDTSLSATPHLWPSIESALVNSRFMILIASPEAAKSKWVSKEVETWLATKGSTTLLLAQTGGELTWETSQGDFVWTPETPLPPILQRQFETEPLWVDLRSYRANPRDSGKYVQGFLNSAAGFASAIRNIPKEDLLSDEVIQQRRNIIWAQGAAAALLVLAVAALWQAFVAIQARGVAEAQRDRAERTLNQIIATANRRVVALSVQANDKAQSSDRNSKPILTVEQTEAINTPGAPLEQVTNLLKLSSSLLSQDNTLGALNAAHKARTILQRDANSEQALKWQMALIEACDLYAQAAEMIGEHDKAGAALRDGLQIAQTLVTANPNDLSLKRYEAFTSQRLGNWYLSNGNVGEAEKYYRDALAIRDSIVIVSETLDSKREVADTISRIGDLYLIKENTVEAIDSYKKSVSILDGLIKTNPSNVDLQRDQSANYQHIADALRRAKNDRDAVFWLTLDLEFAEKLAAANKENLTWQRDRASSLDRLGSVQEGLGNLDEALGTYRKTIEILDEIVTKSPRASSWQRDAAAVRESMGKLLIRKNRTDDAIDAFRRSLATREALAASFEEKGWQIELEAAYRRASEAMWKIGRFQDSLETAEQYLLATALSPEQGTDKPKRVARALGTLSWSALLAKNFSRSVWAAQQGTILAPDLDWIDINYAHALMFSGEADAAKQIYLSGLDKGPEHATAWKKTIREDFLVLKQQSMFHRLMTEIEARFGQ